MFGDPASPRRLVVGVTAATAIVTVSFWALVIGVAASAGGNAVGAAWALGVALVPMAFLTSAFGTGHDRAAGAVVWAMIIALGVGGTLLLLDPATALIGAYAAGATVTVRETAETSVRRRLWFAVGATALAGVTINFATPLGLAMAPALPFVSAVVADRTATAE